jgi:hypothetical protein
MRILFGLLALTLTGAFLLVQPAFAQQSDWQVLKNLPQNQQLRVSLRGGETRRGTLQEVSDTTLILSNGPALHKEDIQRMWVKRQGHRGKHALIGAGIGAGTGLGLGAAVDNSCSQTDFICTGNRGKAIVTPLFALLGTAIGAALPTHNWDEIYRSK